MRSSKKGVKILEYFRNKVAPKGLLFLQEMHSSVETEKQWNDEFKGQLYFSLGKISSCGVLTGFYGNINVVIKKQLNDKNGRILILEVTIDDTEYLLINVSNANTEQHQPKTLQNLFILLENFDNFYNKNVILAADFNLFFNKNIECKEGRPILKKQSVSHITKLQEAFDLCDIRRIRNPKKIFPFQTKAFFRNYPT